MNKKILITVSIIFIAFRVPCQFAEFIPGIDFNGKPLTELIKYTEENSNIRFFYLRKWIDSINVVQPAISSSLKQILESTSQKAQLNYYIDLNENINLSQYYKIEPLVLPVISVKENEEVPDSRILEKSSFVNKENSKGKTILSNELIIIGNSGNLSRSSRADISGFVTEKETGLPIFGVAVYVSDLEMGTITDLYGYYVLSIPPGRHNILFRYMGCKDVVINVQVNGNGSMNIAMETQIIELRGVVVTADKEQNVKGLQLGLDKIDMQTVRQMPSSLGEADIIKSTLLLPGVQTVGEGSSGFNVRGGNSDQNLILMDGAPLFNPSHIFGFFSVFNPDVVKDFKLYKSAIPAQYGGRLSSVFDVSLKKGNLKRIVVNGGISPIAARLSVDGPLINDKVTFLISGRASYSDLIMERIKRLRNSEASFFDLNGKVEYNINNNNLLTISGYYSGDNFKLNYDTSYHYNNLIGIMNLKHTFSKKIYVLLSGIYCNYKYSYGSTHLLPYAFSTNHNINYWEGKTDFTYFLNADHKINFGSTAIRYKINPGHRTPAGSESLFGEKQLPVENAIETGIYLSDEFNITDDLSISAGLRYSGFIPIGPDMVYKYKDDAPKTIYSRIDSAFYSKNELIDFQHGPEIRISVRYLTGAESSIKLNFATMSQYLLMLSNTTAISPTDVWKISGPLLPGMHSTQYTAGFYKDFLSNNIEASMELYYKNFKNILEYRGGADLIMNADLEVDLLNGIGKSYGIEFLFKKKYGVLNGWVSYTYSRSLNMVDSKYYLDKINKGNWFPSNYDKPHDFTIIANYQFSRRQGISSTLTYSTGRPITYPVGKYRYKKRELMTYSDRNEFRVPDYFRWDFSLNIEGNLKANRFIRDSFSFSIYNLTGRDNTYSIFFLSHPIKKVKAYKLSVFAKPIFTVTYNFKF